MSANTRTSTLEHQLADSGGMNLVKWPKQFDVIVTDNLFGDMLSDIAAMLTGSLGMLPSASLGEVDVKTKKRKALYEPVHGSAPDIAGKGLANPIAMIASFGMALRYSFDMGALADKVDAAIAAVLASGLRTADIKSEGTTPAQHHADGRSDPEGIAETARVSTACERELPLRRPGLEPGPGRMLAWHGRKCNTAGIAPDDAIYRAAHAPTAG